MQCIILAGGLGTRIAPLSDNKPKALIEVNSIPFIHYQLTWLSQQGITDVVICIGHLGYMIKNYVADGSKWRLSVSYVDEGEQLLGTAGALKLARQYDKLSEHFFIIYGDSFLPIKIDKIIENYKSSILMTIFKNEEKFDKSNVKLFNNNIVLYNKEFQDAQYIDYGLSIFNRDIIDDYIPYNQKYDLSTLFTQLSDKKMITGYQVYDRFFEIGSFNGLKDFQFWLKNKAKDNAAKTNS